MLDARHAARPVAPFADFRWGLLVAGCPAAVTHHRGLALCLPRCDALTLLALAAIRSLVGPWALRIEGGVLQHSAFQRGGVDLTISLLRGLAGPRRTGVHL